MGYPMSINLRKKIPKSPCLVILELNQERVKRFVDETKALGEVIVAQSLNEVAQQSVNHCKMSLVEVYNLTKYLYRIL
jgi:hypothetical protein